MRKKPKLQKIKSKMTAARRSRQADAPGRACDHRRIGVPSNGSTMGERHRRRAAPRGVAHVGGFTVVFALSSTGATGSAGVAHIHEPQHSRRDDDCGSRDDIIAISRIASNPGPDSINELFQSTKNVPGRCRATSGSATIKDTKRRRRRRRRASRPKAIERRLWDASGHRTAGDCSAPSNGAAFAQNFGLRSCKTLESKLWSGELEKSVWPPVCRCQRQVMDQFEFRLAASLALSWRCHNDRSAPGTESHHPHLERAEGCSTVSRARASPAVLIETLLHASSTCSCSHRVMRRSVLSYIEI